MLDTKILPTNPYGENVTVNMLKLLSEIMIVNRDPDIIDYSVVK